MKSIRFLPSLILIFLTLVPLPVVPQISDDKRSADEQDIFALVLRTQMEDWTHESDKNSASAQALRDKTIAERLNYRVFFVSVKGKDPTDDFMKRFDDIPRTIKKVSNEDAKNPYTPIDKTTHRAGIVFSADSIRWLSSDHAEVTGGYYCGALCAAEITFTVRQENGKWVIKNSQMNWIS